MNVHVHDNRGMQDEHLPLGKGKIDRKRVLRLLKKVNYNGPLNLEIYKDEEKIESKNYICTLLHEL